MILISNTCVNSIIYKNYYKQPYNNPFVNCFIGIKDFTKLVSEYSRSLNQEYKFYVDYSLERKLINDDFKYIKMLTGIYNDQIKINYLHDTNRKYDLEYCREENQRRFYRWLKIKDKELTIFVYVQHPLDTEDDIYRLINLNLCNNCRLRVYTSYAISTYCDWHQKEKPIKDQNYRAKDGYTSVIYVKPKSSPIIEFDSSNYLCNPLQDILRKECFNLITKDIWEYLQENKIEYNT